MVVEKKGKIGKKTTDAREREIANYMTIQPNINFRSAKFEFY